MNLQLCRPAVTDPHKVRPCNYTGLLPYHIQIPPFPCLPIYRVCRYGYVKYSDLHPEYFWRTSCYMYRPPPPLRMVNIDPHSLYFSCIYPQV